MLIDEARLEEFMHQFAGDFGAAPHASAPDRYGRSSCNALAVRSVDPHKAAGPAR